MIASPKKSEEFYIMDGLYAISLFPTQKWECIDFRCELDVYYLRRGNVSMQLSEEEFERYFMVVE